MSVVRAKYVATPLGLSAITAFAAATNASTMPNLSVEGPISVPGHGSVRARNAHPRLNRLMEPQRRDVRSKATVMKTKLLLMRGTDPLMKRSNTLCL